MKQIRAIFILCLFVSFFAASTQRLSAQRAFTMVELNAENLFDCIHEDGIEDKDFLPAAARRWTPNRLNKKLDLLGRTLCVIGGETLPDLVALCEVENDTVMQRLTRKSVLWAQGYRYFITHSADIRGINVALMYRPETFLPLTHGSIRPSFERLPPKKTRDVLYVSGRIQTGDTLDVFVVHAPSKLDPRKEGRPFRMSLMKQIKAVTDSIIKERETPQIIVAGDFNATPDDAALTEGLQARILKESDSVSAKTNELYNLTAHCQGRHKGIKGSYYFKGVWEMIDHIIVNGKLLDARNGLNTKISDCSIGDEYFLLEYDEGNLMPKRTYKGMKWNGGLSDHLPLVVKFDYSW